MEHEEYTEYGAWAKRIGSDDRDLIFTTSWSARLARNRAIEQIANEKKNSGVAAVHDAESIVVMKREVRIKRGAWEDV